MTSDLSLTSEMTPRPEDLLMSQPSYIFSAIALFLIGFFGFFLNLIGIVLMCKDRQLWTPLNVILFNLVCSDFSVSILGNPFTLISAIAQHWYFGPTMCVAYGFFMSLLGITSITTLTVLSFERYLMVSHPLSTQQHLSKQSAVITIVGIWIYSLALTMPPLFGWGEYVNEAANISCSVNWESKTYSSTTYILFLFIFGLVIPVCVISFSYLNIIRTMRQQNSLRMGRINKAERRVTVMVAVMIIAFMIAWTPYSVMALIIQFGDSTLVSPGLAVVPALVAKSSICYNPLIYVGLNTQFQSSWRCLLGRDKTEQNAEGGKEPKTRSKAISQSSLDDIDDRRKQSTTLFLFSNVVNAATTSSTSCNNTLQKLHQHRTTKTSQLLQLFPRSPVLTSLASKETKETIAYTNKTRKLSTVFQESEIVETALAKSDELHEEDDLNYDHADYL